MSVYLIRVSRQALPHIDIMLSSADWVLLGKHCGKPSAETCPDLLQQYMELKNNRKDLSQNVCWLTMVLNALQVKDLSSSKTRTSIQCIKSSDHYRDTKYYFRSLFSSKLKWIVHTHLQNANGQSLHSALCCVLPSLWEGGVLHFREVWCLTNHKTHDNGTVHTLMLYLFGLWKCCTVKLKKQHCNIGIYTWLQQYSALTECIVYQNQVDPREILV